MKMLTLFLLFVFSVVSNSCDVGNSAPVNSNNSATVSPTQNENQNKKSEIAIDSKKTDETSEEFGNEITECSPDKIFSGETLKISFKKSHGQNFAIYQEDSKDFYFLTANGENYFPFISPNEFEKRDEIYLDVSSVRNPSEELFSNDETKTKPYFSKTGWYRVIIGHQALDVDFEDMPVTGSCRVYYEDKERPAKK